MKSKYVDKIHLTCKDLQVQQAKTELQRVVNYPSFFI